MARRVHVVAHTHWDREWYRPFPTFRIQLVELVTTLLDALEAGRISHFQLDGQTAVIDDHLELRPDDRPRIEALVSSGRLAIGPWYTLPDEFLVSGETHVRNLRLGLARAEGLGGSMRLGYLPDMFGHVAQMPQILRGFGFTDAVVWRGVPAAVTTPTFRWVAPDGSSVRAEYLPGGYSNGARPVSDPAALVAELDAFRLQWGEVLSGDPVLWMNGTDHRLPDTHLPEVATGVAAITDRYEVVSTTLVEHLASRPTEDLPTWCGEMRSGARSPVLRNVASTRLDIKAAAARAERWLERIAEPMSACWLPAEDWPAPFLERAWLDVIRNAAHDSICGCSADEVNDAVAHRYAEATRVAEALADRALIRVLAASGQAAIAVNPTARPRGGIASAVLPGEVPPPETQQLAVHPTREHIATLPWTRAESLLLAAVADDPKVAALDIDPGRPGHPAIATIRADLGGHRPATDAVLAQIRQAAHEATATDPDALVRVDRLRAAPTQEVLLRVDDVPGFGWRGLAPADLGAHAVRALAGGLTNGLVTVVPDQADGTVSINGAAGFGRLIDDGDGGDTYNWAAVAEDRLIDRPLDVDVLVAEAGPVRGRIEIVRTYRWPTHLVDGVRRGAAEVRVTTNVEVRAGEDLVRFDISFDNSCSDHRVRVALPLTEPASTSAAECAFGIVERGLDAEGGPDEPAVATSSSRRFVRAGGVLAVHDGLPEYELIDLIDTPDGPAASTLAITVLRSIGVLSQGPSAARSLAAGPPIPTPGAQLLGPRTASFVVHLDGRDPYAVADEAFTPLLVARFPGRGGIGDPTRRDTALVVDGAEVTALRRLADGRRELRVVNPTDEVARLRVAGCTGEVIDLAGEPVGQAFDGEADLRPWQILTVALDEHAPG